MFDGLSVPHLACEEARILPEIRVEIAALEPGRFKVAVQDNTPGIVPDQIARIFGKCCMAPSSIGSRNRAVSKAWAFRPRACMRSGGSRQRRAHGTPILGAGHPLSGRYAR